MKVFEKQSELEAARFIAHAAREFLVPGQNEIHVLTISPKRIPHLPEGPWMHTRGRGTISSFVQTFDGFPYTQRVRKMEAIANTSPPRYLTQAHQELTEARVYSASQIHLCLQNQPGALPPGDKPIPVILMAWAEFDNFPVLLELCRLLRQEDSRLLTVFATNPHRSSDKIQMASDSASHLDVLHVGEKRDKAKTLRKLLQALLLALDSKPWRTLLALG